MTPGTIGIISVILLVLLMAGLSARNFFGRKPAAEEVERRRRLDINLKGKMGDGEIIDVEVREGHSAGEAHAVPFITYTYSVAGVVYTASQDVAVLQGMLPEDPMSMIGPISIKFDPHNPANSIVLCEAWSGLRQAIRRDGAPAPRQ